MWRENRLRQMALFQNIAIGHEYDIDGHGSHAVTPEQVYIMLGYSQWFIFLIYDQKNWTKIGFLRNYLAFCLSRGQSNRGSKLG